MIKFSQLDVDELVVVFRERLAWGQFHPDVIPSEPVHRPTPLSLLEKHLGLLPDVAGIECLGLLVAERKQLVSAQFLLLFFDYVWNTEGGRPRALRVREHVQLSDRQLPQ